MKVKVFFGLMAVVVCVVGIVMAMDGETPAVVKDGGRVALVTELDKESYAVGVALSQSVKGAELNIDAFCQGMRDFLGDKELALTDEEIGTVLRAFNTKMQQLKLKEQNDMLSKNKAEGEAFLAENGKKEGVKTTASGLQYQIIEPGTGKKPLATDTVKVHYKGTLINGEEFDSSYKRGEPAIFPLNGVIKGWTEGLQLLNEGGKAKLFIPSDLAYGDSGNRSIEPAKTLIFEVELIEINPEEE